MAHSMTVHEAIPITDDDVHRSLDSAGRRVQDSILDPWLEDVTVEMLRNLYRDMRVVRRIDAEGVALQRQGQLGLWAPCQGQEAAQVGAGRALASGDFVFPSYREHGFLYVRGGEPSEFVRMWRAEELSAYDPAIRRMGSPQIIIGAQTLHAVGYAMGARFDQERAVAAGDVSTEVDVAIACFGDGATSQGDVSEAMVFASSYDAPVVFFCQNNHFAISEPVQVQSRVAIAGRAEGFGIAALRIDGNDVLAVHAAMRWALDHARSGRGPAFIEAVTYRMGPHTTADDPTRYRDPEELQHWRDRDPLTRVEAFLRAHESFDDAFVADVEAEADAFTAAMRHSAVTYQSRSAVSVLDNVYAEPHTGIDRARVEFGAYVNSLAEEDLA